MNSKCNKTRVDFGVQLKGQYGIGSLRLMNCDHNLPGFTGETEYSIPEKKKSRIEMLTQQKISIQEKEAEHVLLREGLRSRPFCFSI